MVNARYILVTRLVLGCACQCVAKPGVPLCLWLQNHDSSRFLCRNDDHRMYE